MPIKVNKRVDKKAKTPKHTRELNQSLRETQEKRIAKRRTKYHRIRKDKAPRDYDRVQIIVDGEERQLSQSSKFLLDMLIKD